MTYLSPESVYGALTDGFVDLREVIAKNNPDASAVHVPASISGNNAPTAVSLRPISRRGVKRKDAVAKAGGASTVDPSKLTRKQAERQKKVNTFGLAGNAVATAGGAHALYLASKSPDLPMPKKLRRIIDSRSAKPGASRVAAAGAKAATQAKKVPVLRSILNNPKKAAATAAGGWVGLHGVELAADVVANRALVRERKQLHNKINKSAVSDVTWTAEISKVDDEKRQVFGWCSLSKVNGEPVVDRQNDFVPLEEIEKSAYKYVLESRKGGDMHKRQMKKGVMGSEDEPVHTADLIESFVVTPEKLKQMGLNEDALPHGWWVGFKVNDDEQWDLVKQGKRTGFSIHGSGKRTPGVL